MSKSRPVKNEAKEDVYWPAVQGFHDQIGRHIGFYNNDLSGSGSCIDIIAEGMVAIAVRQADKGSGA